MSDPQVPRTSSAGVALSRSLVVKIVLGLALVGVAIWLGRDFGHHLPELEKWVAARGAWGDVVFVVAAVGLTSIFVPDTVFAVAAGALFGVLWGTVLITIASLLTATVNFAVGRTLLRGAVQAWLARSPKLAAIERAVNREGLRFQFLLRLTPINPVTVSYILGATSTPFPRFIIACLGLVPALFVEVYFGYVASHVAKISGGASEHSSLHSALTIGGLLLCIGMFVYIVRVARQALAAAEESPAVAQQSK